MEYLSINLANNPFSLRSMSGAGVSLVLSGCCGTEEEEKLLRELSCWWCWNGWFKLRTGNRWSAEVTAEVTSSSAITVGAREICWENWLPMLRRSTVLDGVLTRKREDIMISNSTCMYRSDCYEKERLVPACVWIATRLGSREIVIRYLFFHSHHVVLEDGLLPLSSSSFVELA